MNNTTPYVTNFNRNVMNDTITLKLSRNDFTVLEPWEWQPQLPDVISPTSDVYLPFFYQFHLNRKSPSNYYPKLTLISLANKISRKPKIELTIQFSAPKILFDNNVDEIEETDFEKLIDTLLLRLAEMGVKTHYEALSNAEIRKVDFCKNILLNNYETVTHATRTVSKFDIPKRLKIYNDRFQNEGHALRIYNTQQQIIIYDKVKDAFKNKDEAEDKDRTKYQQQLLKAIQSSHSPIEILRLEIRLLNVRKLNAVLTELGFSANLTFRDIFKKEIAKTILKQYWKLITPEQSTFLLYYMDENILKQVLGYLKKQGINKRFIETAGIAYLMYHSDKLGVRDLELTSYSNYSTRTWLRNERYFDLINNIVKDTSKSNFLEDVNNSLEVFEPFKVSKLSEMTGLTFDNSELRH